MMGIRAFFRLAGCGLALVVAGCAETTFVANSTKLVTTPTAPPPPAYKVGKPYEIEGIWYYPKIDYSYDETGIASWYGPDFNGKPTASGEIYDQNGLTAAHRTLPMPTIVQVTNLENGRSLRLRVNDRGPFSKGRVLDVSKRAAQLLGFIENGTARVRVQVIADESQALAAALSGGTMVPIDQPQPPVPTAAPTIGVTSQALATAAVPATTPAKPASAPSATPTPSATPAKPATATPAATTPAKPAVVPASATATKPVAPAAQPPVQSAATAAALQPDGRVTQMPVKPTSIFIQAGAFTKKQNAEGLTAELRRLGAASMTPVMVGGQQFYRVRLGPISSVTEADRLLAELVRRGHADAKIVVD
jgi:rare lipoprotein A